MLETIEGAEQVIDMLARKMLKLNSGKYMLPKDRFNEKTDIQGVSKLLQAVFNVAGFEKATAKISGQALIIDPVDSGLSQPYAATRLRHHFLALKNVLSAKWYEIEASEMVCPPPPSVDKVLPLMQALGLGAYSVRIQNEIPGAEPIETIAISTREYEQNIFPLVSVKESRLVA